MTTIYKFPFKVDDVVYIMMHKDAKVLMVGKQGNTNCMWAMVDTSLPIVAHQFRIFGTGHPIEDSSLKHVESWTDGPFVWHMFQTDFAKSVTKVRLDNKK